LAQNNAVNKFAVNAAKYPGEHLHIDASGPLLLPMGRKEHWLKIRDEFSRITLCPKNRQQHLF
jgi:hypothetical protein